MARPFLLLDFPERLQGWQKVLPYALLLSITFALYSVSLYFQFVWDDVAYITRNYRIQGLDWMHIRAFWSTTYLGHYAPVQHSYLAVLYHFFGMEPFGYHLGQLVVHGAIVCLVYVLAKKLENARVALLATVLYAVHPTNIETVAWVSESKSTLAFLFFLLSFWFFIRMRESARRGWSAGVLSAAFLTLSLLAKINTVVAPAIFLLYDYKQGATLKTLRWRSLLPFFAIGGLFVLIHLRAFHGSAESMEGVYYGGFWLHFMHLPLLLAFYVDMTVFPYAVSAWEMFPVQNNFNALIALGWAGLAAVAFLLSRASRSIQFWALWFFVFLLPVLQIIPFPIWVADRYLYIPLIGGLVLVSRFFFSALQRLARPLPRWAAQAAMLGAVLLLAWKTLVHVPVWRDDLSLWVATTPTCATSSYCHLNLALALLRNGQRELGVQHMLRAVEIRPGWRVLERLGDVYTLTLRDYRQAQIAYHMALEQTGPKGTPEIYGKMARAYYLAGDLEEAARIIESGKKINPNDLGLWITDGFVRWKQGNWNEARSSLRRAVAMTGGSVNPVQFFTEYLGNPREVGRMLSDLRSSEPIAAP